MKTPSGYARDVVSAGSGETKTLSAEQEFLEKMRATMLEAHPWLSAYTQRIAKLEKQNTTQWNLLVDLRERLKKSTSAGVETWPEYKRLLDLDPP